MFVGGFDQTFVVPVLSRILGDLDIAVDEFGQAAWIVNGYLLGYAVALLGRRPTYMAISASSCWVWSSSWAALCSSRSRPTCLCSHSHAH